MFVIYSYKSPSNRYYIGITCNEARRRYEHKKKTKNNEDTKFARALKKYGIDNLEYSILAKVKTIEEAKLLEIKYIKEYDSYRNGYNSTLGGDISNGAAKLTEYLVNQIRKELQIGKFLNKEIAKKYNISESVISDIKNNKRWSYTKGAKMIEKKNRFNVGSDNAGSKLDENLVKEIKLKLAKGVSRRNIQKEYGVSKTNIQMIATEKSWTHVKVDEYKYKKVRNGNAKLNEDRVRKIWLDRKKNMTQTELAEKYQVSRSTIQNLLKGNIWKDIFEEMN